MDKKAWFVRIMSGVVAVSFIGLGATFIMDFVTASQKESRKESKVQAMMRETFDRNRELKKELETVRERYLDTVEQMQNKDEEVERLVQKLSSNVQLIQKLTKDRERTGESLSRLQDEFETTERSAETMEQERQQIESERAKQEKEFGVLQNQISQLQEQLSAAMKEKEKAALGRQDEAGRAGEGSGGTLSEISDLRTQLDKVLREKEAAIERVRALESAAAAAGGPKTVTSLADVREQLGAFAEQEPEPAKTLRSAEPIRDSMKLFQELKEENRQWKKHEAEYLERLANFEDEVERIEKEKDRTEERWKKDAARAKRDFEKEVQRRIDHLQNKLETTQRDLEKTKEKLTAKSNEILEMEEAGKEDRRQIKVMEHERETALREKGAFEVQVTELEAKQKQDKIAFFYNLGLAYTHAGLFRDAERMYLRVLELDPDDAEVHYNLGILYDEHLQKLQEGIKHYEKFIYLTDDRDRRSKVRTWVDVAKRKYGIGRETNMESADSAFDKLFLTRPS